MCIRDSLRGHVLCPAGGHASRGRAVGIPERGGAKGKRRRSGAPPSHGTDGSAKIIPYARPRMPAWHPGPFCIYHISASVLWHAFCFGGCPCSVLPHLCLSQHAPLACLAVTIDLINILLRGKHAPSAHEHSPHHQHGHRPHQAHELHGIENEG